MPETDTTPPVTAEGSYDWWRTEVAARDADLEHLRHEFEEMTKLHDAKHQDWQRSEGELGRLRNRITALEANGSELLARAERAEADLNASHQVQVRASIPEPLERLRADLDDVHHDLKLVVGDAYTTAASAAFEVMRRLAAASAERDALKAELALHVGCRVDISIGDALRLIRGEESTADAPSPVPAATEAHGEAGGAEDA